MYISTLLTLSFKSCLHGHQSLAPKGSESVQIIGVPLCVLFVKACSPVEGAPE